MRRYAVQAPGVPSLQVFDRQVKKLQKDRAALNIERSRQADYLKEEIAKRLVERLLVRVLQKVPGDHAFQIHIRRSRHSEQQYLVILLRRESAGRR